MSLPGLLPRSLKEEVVITMDQAEWAWLKPHLQRDALIWVGDSLELLQVAREVASNETQKIQTHVTAGQVSKPSAEQIEAWDLEPSKKFNVVIVQPFVLIQEIKSVLH